MIRPILIYGPEIRAEQAGKRQLLLTIEIKYSKKKEVGQSKKLRHTTTISRQRHRKFIRQRSYWNEHVSIADSTRLMQAARDL